MLSKSCLTRDFHCSLCIYIALQFPFEVFYFHYLFIMLNFLDIIIKTLNRVISSLFKFLAGSFFRQIEYPKQSSGAMKNILILGGSYAGVSLAHRILKQAANAEPFKITLISPNRDFYWNVAAPRGIIPGQLTDDQLFQPIAAGFSNYPTGRFEFKLASAEHVNFEAKTVQISSPEGMKILNYDYLVLATGTRINGNVPLKGLGSTEATKTALYDFQAQIGRANTIVIAGAGVTGVEVAGELGFEYGEQKEIVLVSLGT
jgi:hypothetical protein